jgi:hypothetical protein
VKESKIKTMIEKLYLQRAVNVRVQGSEGELYKSLKFRSNENVFELEKIYVLSSFCCIVFTFDTISFITLSKFDPQFFYTTLKD